MLPEEILTALAQKISLKNLEVRRLSGGSINNAFAIYTSSGSYFLKYNSAASFPDMFSSEFKGLNLLAKTKSIRIPQPLSFYEGEHYSFLLLELIESAIPSPDFWEIFAENLARLHQHSNSLFGLNFNNYMGSLPQPNKYHDSFSKFFIEERLIPQIKIAYDKGLLETKHLKHAERMYPQLDSIFPLEKPALVHGDLWSGNFMTDEQGKPVIMDPAPYFGHREVDIAMTGMFGGFSQDFYQYYQAAYPMEKNWQSRLDFYRLYPVLIHLNLFGSSYLYDFDRVIRRF